MGVINVRPIVYQLLSKQSELKLVAPDYPSDWQDFPSAIYRTTQTAYFTDSSNQELQTYWTVTIEIYGDKRFGDVGKIAIAVENNLKNIGFTGSTKDANTAGLNRKILEFSGIVDNESNYVFSN